MKNFWTFSRRQKVVLAFVLSLSLIGLTATRGSAFATTTTTSTSAELALQANNDLKTAASTDYFAPFDANWGYTKGDLGATYSASTTTFKVWAPTATAVTLLSYGKNDSPTAALAASYSMVRGTTVNSTDQTQNSIGVWTYSLPGDDNGLVYAYQLTFGDGTVNDYPQAGANAPITYGTFSSASVTMTTQDPYSIAVVQGGLRSVVEAPTSVTPNGFTASQGSTATWRVASPTQAMIDEIHVRDFTNSASSGVTAANEKGKFLGVSQLGTTDPNTGKSTGLSYLKQEGFNYVQIMPMYDFASVADTGTPTPSLPNPYNWGYDPRNYDVPEGAYASSVTDPTTRLLEAKQMIQGLHNQGMGVVMDVVYNHVYSQSSSPFEQTQPGYYFRPTAASGCGNDTATNHEMFRQYILNSIAYWAKSYDLDGFRLDIMANYDKDTVNMIRAELTAIDPHILMYGEGWYMGTDVPADQKVDVSLAPNTPGVGYFNNGERDTIQSFIAGANGVNGATEDTSKIFDAIQGSGNGLMNYGSVSQAINYVEIHDGQTLSDLEWTYLTNDTLAAHNARTELGSAINILAEGTTVMQAGQEFNRTRYVDVSGQYPTIAAAKAAVNAGTDTTGNAAAQIELARNPYNGVVTINGITYYEGDAASNINWDLESTNQAQANFISRLMKFKEANPSFWPNDYTQIYNGIFIQPLRHDSGIVSYVMNNGSNKYLVIINATGSAYTIGTTSSSPYYGYDLTGKNVILSSDSTVDNTTLTGATATFANLSASIIQLQ